VDLTRISTVLPNESFLVRSVLQPVAILCPRPRQLPRLGIRDQARKDEHGNAADTGIVQTVGERLSANINMDEDGLRLACDSRIAIGHGDSGYLGGAGDKLRPCVRSFSLAFDNCLEDGGMIRPDIDKTCCDTSLLIVESLAIAIKRKG
jgi:hypothetical protein